jgi:hypothetical protein
MTESRPGLNAHRLVRLMREAVTRCELDLSGAVVMTEAATGAYIVTPVLAAMAGAARVVAVTRTTPYGTAEEITRQTHALAALAGVSAATIRVALTREPDAVEQADVVTNSGHVRPIDAEMVARMKPTAVVPLMYESWEFRPADVDLEACRRRGVCVAGTNERHSAIDVFSYLGVMAVRLLHDMGVAVYRSNVLLLCNNPFAPFIERGLAGAGASVTTVDRLPRQGGPADCDAIVIAARPGDRPVLTADDAALIAERWPGAVVAQFWGDIDRAALQAAGVPYCPVAAPRAGHMAVLPSAVGPEPIVRLQCGGLKVGELLWRSRRQGETTEASVAAAVGGGFGQSVD